jgi:hypothetical protein
MLRFVSDGPVAAVSRVLAVALLGSGLATGLVITNPGPDAFAEFGGRQLTATLIKELCVNDGVTGLLRLVIHNCPALIKAQRPLLGLLVRTHSTRSNLGLFSIYRTRLDLAALLPGLRDVPDLRLPRYEATTLAAAGKFLLLETHEPASSERRP